MKDEIGPTRCEAFPQMESIIESVNDYHKNKWPRDPSTKDFDLQIKSVPEDFLSKDMHINRERHILFATKQQLKLSKNAKTRLVDGTFKFVKSPFTQLF